MLAYDELLLREPNLLIPGKQPVGPVRSTVGELQMFVTIEPGRRAVDRVTGASIALESDAVLGADRRGHWAVALNVSDQLFSGLPVRVSSADTIITQYIVKNGNNGGGGPHFDFIGSGVFISVGEASGFATNETMMFQEGVNRRYVRDTFFEDIPYCVVMARGPDGAWQFYRDGRALTAYDGTNGGDIPLISCTSLLWGSSKFSSTPRTGGYSVQVLRTGGRLAGALGRDISADPFGHLIPA